MDEITLVNLLNKICGKNTDLTWKLNCKYYQEWDASIMQIHFLRSDTLLETSKITFRMETGQVIEGRHRGLMAFAKSTPLVDVLLDILIYESSKPGLLPN